MKVKNRLANRRSDKQNTAGRAGNTATQTNLMYYIVLSKRRTNTAPTQLAKNPQAQANHIRMVLVRPAGNAAKSARLPIAQTTSTTSHNKPICIAHYRQQLQVYTLAGPPQPNVQQESYQGKQKQLLRAPNNHNPIPTCISISSCQL